HVTRWRDEDRNGRLADLARGSSRFGSGRAWSSRTGVLSEPRRSWPVPARAASSDVDAGPGEPHGRSPDTPAGDARSRCPAYAMDGKNDAKRQADLGPREACPGSSLGAMAQIWHR